jgi:pilus assembly protein Flp/PilA
MSRSLRLWKDETGATAIEYGLIAALISIAIYVALVAFGTGVSDLFNLITDTVVSTM